MAEKGKPDSRGLNFLEITDFSPGIYSAGNTIATTGPLAAPGIFPAPPGAADGNNTWACMSMPNGGLGPMPAITGQYSMGTIGIGGGARDVSCLINSQVTPADELVIGTTVISGSAQDTQFWSFVVQTAALNSIQSESYTYSGNHNFVAYPFTTIMENAESVPQPVVILPVTSPDGPNNGNIWVYPQVNNPNFFAVDEILAGEGSHQGGTTVGHQGRVVVFRLISPPGWPVPNTPRINEPISFTDPPETETLVLSNEEFVPEFPHGYGVVGSVSAGELFAVKARGGAGLIQGDLNNPTVTSLPGVRSTGPLYGRTDSNQLGLFYCTYAEGAWVWNGGNTSQKISAQLDDNFFIPNPRNPSDYYGWYCQRWADWMLFSNNYVHNPNTGAWWRLSDPNVFSFFWFVPGYQDNIMYGALASVTEESEPFLAVFDRTVPAKSYNWQSLPIKMPAEDRTSTTREVVIRASNPYNDPAPNVAVTLIDDMGNTVALDVWNLEPDTDTVQEIRVNARLAQTTTLAIALVANGPTSGAPVIHGLSIGYRPREHTALA